MHRVDVDGKHPGQQPFPSTAANEAVDGRWGDSCRKSLVTTDEIVLKSENGCVPMGAGEGDEVHAVDPT